jgi:hypothetical protein
MKSMACRDILRPMSQARGFSAAKASPTCYGVLKFQTGNWLKGSQISDTFSTRDAASAALRSLQEKDPPEDGWEYEVRKVDCPSHTKPKALKSKIGSKMPRRR